MRSKHKNVLETFFLIRTCHLSCHLFSQFGSLKKVIKLFPIKYDINVHSFLYSICTCSQKFEKFLEKCLLAKYKLNFNSIY